MIMLYGTSALWLPRHFLLAAASCYDPVEHNFHVCFCLPLLMVQEAVVANEETDVAMIEKEAFYAAIGDSFEDAIAFNAAAERLK